MLVAVGVLVFVTVVLRDRVICHEQFIIVSRHHRHLRLMRLLSTVLSWLLLEVASIVIKIVLLVLLLYIDDIDHIVDRRNLLFVLVMGFVILNFVIQVYSRITLRIFVGVMITIIIQI